MACTSLSIPTSPANSTKRTNPIFKDHVPIRRSCSDHNHLCSYTNRIRAASSTQPNNSRSIGIFPFKISSSIVPNCLGSFLFGPYKPMDVVEKNMNMNMVEKSGERTGNEGEEIKRANWMEWLVELRSKWRNIWQQKQVEDEEEDNNNGEEGCCAEGCSLEEKNGEMGYKSYDPESFSRFLVRVPWSETKLFSKLAFLCNMVYVIPEIKGEVLQRYYDLQFVTSSFKKKAAYMEASTMTVVVAANESEKHETTKDFRAGQHSSPCEWFVCDDSSTFTRCFVVQGLDSHASWQAYLLFGPTKFEGTNVLVHRGIYEAAEAMYEQFMPEILDHLERKGEQAKFQFTGHCIGGSIALLVHLMLLTRNLVKPSTLRPVVTFGSPFVFCKGHKILEQLSLDESDHIHCVMMHRDIVPRAFSSNYNNQVITLLRRLNGSFQTHPCLIKSKRLYSPMGNLFILQPDEKSSPPHPLLPPGSALYVLNKTQCGSSSGVLMAFLNSPHPLETFSDPAAYGSEGTILRDHDSCNYLKAMNMVLRQHTRMVARKVRKQRNLLWPILTSPSPHSWNDEDKSDLQRTKLVTRE
ncbi:hypothetical protein L3X38_035102 [Prunus dulcis]|uniref:Fungal lipase-type domain-containing protein n=1 Tax=Prunus dulcis TaxID=3755 RepID=A0AAD4VJ96_PRUDU|nr:hypothetical protein L3X38_035102 [Prunus dulcis]